MSCFLQVQYQMQLMFCSRSFSECMRLACWGGRSLCCFDMMRLRKTLPLSYCAMSCAFPSILDSLLTFSAALRSYMMPNVEALPIFECRLAYVVNLCMRVLGESGIVHTSQP